MERPGGWYHVTSRGNERQAIYRDGRDRQHFCELLGEVVATFGWRIHAYVLMANHFHLLVETPETNLSRGMQWLNVSYSVWFNRRHNRSGHLFQGRYKAIVVESEAWGLELSRYLHLNPVRVRRLGLDKAARQRDEVGLGERPDPAQVKERVEKLRDYRWTSYRAYLGLVPAPQWLTVDGLLRQGLRGKSGDGAEAYRSYVESAIREGLAESPWEKLTAQTLLGSARFVRKMREGLTANPREQTGVRKLAERPGLAPVILAVETVKGERWEDFRDRYGDSGRDLVLYLGRRHSGLKLRELGQAAGSLDYMAVSLALHRFGRRLRQDATLRATVAQCEKILAKCKNV